MHEETLTALLPLTAPRRASALQALARRPYDLSVVCLPDFAFVQDGCRRDDAFRAEQHAWTLDQLARQGVQPLIVGGALAERVAQVLRAVAHGRTPH